MKRVFSTLACSATIIQGVVALIFLVKKGSAYKVPEYTKVSSMAFDWNGPTITFSVKNEYIIYAGLNKNNVENLISIQSLQNSYSLVVEQTSYINGEANGNWIKSRTNILQTEENSYYYSYVGQGTLTKAYTKYDSFTGLSVATSTSELLVLAMVKSYLNPSHFLIVHGLGIIDITSLTIVKVVYYHLLNELTNIIHLEGPIFAMPNPDVGSVHLYDESSSIDFSESSSKILPFEYQAIRQIGKVKGINYLIGGRDSGYGLVLNLDLFRIVTTVYFGTTTRIEQMTMIPTYNISIVGFNTSNGAMLYINDNYYYETSFQENILQMQNFNNYYAIEGSFDGNFILSSNGANLELFLNTNLECSTNGLTGDYLLYTEGKTGFSNSYLTINNSGVLGNKEGLTGKGSEGFGTSGFENYMLNSIKGTCIPSSNNANLSANSSSTPDMLIVIRQNVRNALVVIGSVGLLNSACSINVGGSFIKIFQIIELFGKLYYIPVNFTSYTDAWLEQANQLADFVELNPNVVFHEDPDIENLFYGKLTVYSVKRSILRSDPFFVIIYLILESITVILKMIKFIFGVKHEPRKLIDLMMRLNNVVFQINFVDFVFYSSYSIIGSWSVKYWNFPFLINKIISMLILVLGTIEISTQFRYVLTFPNTLVNTSSVLNKDNSKDNNKINARFVCSQILFINEDMELKSEHLRKPTVRSINPIFTFKIIAFQILLTTTQNGTYFGAFGMLMIGTVSLVHFSYVTIRYKPFRSVLVIFKKFIFELVLSGFLISIGLPAIYQLVSNSSIEGNVIDIFEKIVLLMVVICILLETLSFILQLKETLKRFGVKSKKRIVNFPSSNQNQNQNPNPNNNNLGKKSLIKFAAKRMTPAISLQSIPEINVNRLRKFSKIHRLHKSNNKVGTGLITNQMAFDSSKNIYDSIRKANDGDFLNQN